MKIEEENRWSDGVMKTMLLKISGALTVTDFEL